MKIWIIRILLTVIILTGLMLGTLNLLEGTGESQKHGVEQIFGGATHGNATIGQLNKMTLFPQINIDASDVTINNFLGKGTVTAERIMFSFNLLDLILNRKRINALDMEYLTISPGLLNTLPFDLDYVRITPEPQPFVEANGTYNQVPFALKTGMEMIPDSPNAYRFAKENPFTLKIGTTEITGLFTPGTKDNTTLKNLEISRNGIRCTTLPAENKFTMSSLTGNIFALAYESDTNKTSLEDLCSKIKRYSL